MIIPKETLEKWENLREEGDVPLLAKEIGKSEPTIYRIFSTGEAHFRDAKIINDFYKKRKRYVSAIKMDDQD